MESADPGLQAPARPVRLGSTACDVEQRPDGSVRLRLKELLQP